MMNKTKRGVLRRGIAVVASVITIVASTSTIFAYEPFLTTDADAIDIANSNDFGNFESDDIFVDFHYSNGVFVYEDGTQVEIHDDISPYVLCNHNMVSGYYHAHKANGSGGCTVTVYNAKKCSKCGYLDIGSLSSTHTYVVCPH